MSTIGWIVLAVIIILVVIHAAGMVYAYHDFRATRDRARKEHPEYAWAYDLEDEDDHIIYFFMILLWEFNLPVIKRQQAAAKSKQAESQDS